MPLSPRSRRPERTRLQNELGKWQTLPDGPDFFIRVVGLPAAEALVFLGLGPDPAGLFKRLGAAARQVHYLEAPDFRCQMAPDWAASIPPEWQDLGLDGAWEQRLRALLPDACVYCYAPNLRLFPSFWAPVLGLCRAHALGPACAPHHSSPSVLIPGADKGLLIREVAHGFKAAGAAVRIWDIGEEPFQSGTIPAETPEPLVTLLAEERPALFFSVNFQGLDAYGERYHLLRQAGARTAVWCVDNPWHLLQGVKSSYWKELILFVTDASFIEPLARHGARHVHHLPLAAWPEHFAAVQAGGAALGLADRLVFVGRSEFPGKKGFFAGQKLDPGAWRAAEGMLDVGARPDFAWWLGRLGIESLWPGAAVRAAGHGAEESSREFRTRCLRAAARSFPLAVYGDPGWRAALGSAAGVVFHEPVDYYGQLREIYNQGKYTLNVTSLLLPAGLTQRHFDVWTAGGFLVTDATPGLGIFPEELTRPIAFDAVAGPWGLEAVLRRLDQTPGLLRDMGVAWQGLILGAHTYAHRMTEVLERVLGPVA